MTNEELLKQALKNWLELLKSKRNKNREHRQKMKKKREEERSYNQICFKVAELLFPIAIRFWKLNKSSLDLPSVLERIKSREDEERIKSRDEVGEVK